MNDRSLRVGLLVDEGHIPAYARGVIEDLFESNRGNRLMKAVENLIHSKPNIRLSRSSWLPDEVVIS